MKKKKNQTNQKPKETQLNMGRTKANNQVLQGNKRSSWFKARLVGREKIPQTTEQKNNSNAKLPKYHNVTWW